MSRGRSREWRIGKRRQTIATRGVSRDVVRERELLYANEDRDWSKTPEDYQDLLERIGAVELVTAEMHGRATRMDRDGLSRRACLQNMMAAAGVEV